MKTHVILVTGGTGYIARWCIAELLSQGHRVRTTVRSLDKAPLARKAVAVASDEDRLSFHVADLTHDSGWAEAMEGCRYVLHIASPLGMNNLKTVDEMVEVARGGTLRVLKAALAANVERIVMTSAANASSPTFYSEPGTTDETLWTDENAPGIIPYRKSKTVAEKAAWEFMEKAGQRHRLTTILPGAVLGPVLSADNLNSVQVVGKLLRGEIPALPRIALEVVDVRDLADVHVRAMVSPAAGGERFLATGEFLWFSDIAAALRDGLGKSAARVPQRTMPDFLVRLFARFKPELREVAISLGRRNRHTTSKAEKLLGWKARSGRETIVDCAKSLIEWKVV